MCQFVFSNNRIVFVKVFFILHLFFKQLCHIKGICTPLPQQKTSYYNDSGEVEKLNIPEQLDDVTVDSPCLVWYTVLHANLWFTCFDDIVTFLEIKNLSNTFTMMLHHFCDGLKYVCLFQRWFVMNHFFLNIMKIYANEYIFEISISYTLSSITNLGLFT